jgi:hypothetical protein
MAEVAGGCIELAALQQHARVVRERAQRRQRLVQFMGDAGCHLAQRRQLAGLHQFVLRRAQLAFGARRSATSASSCSLIAIRSAVRASTRRSSSS